MRPSPNDVIGGKYRITRLIGDGGMGAVYEARHEVLGSPVALKFLHAELAKRPGLATRFLQEARVSASIYPIEVSGTSKNSESFNPNYAVQRYIRHNR